jgi:transposase
MLAFIDLETRVPLDHPLRVIKELADQAFVALSPGLNLMYAQIGRPSIPPERLLKSSLLIALFSVRSERAFCEQLDYDLLFRWFLDMNLIEPSFDATTFTKNRERLLKHQVGQALFDEVVLAADRQGLLSDEHFTVDGTLIEAAASLKSFKPRDVGTRPPMTATPVTPRWTFMGRSGAMPLIRALRTPRPACFGRARGRKPGWYSWPMP